MSEVHDKMINWEPTNIPEQLQKKTQALYQGRKIILEADKDTPEIHLAVQNKFYDDLMTENPVLLQILKHNNTSDRIILHYDTKEIKSWLWTPSIKASLSESKSTTTPLNAEEKESLFKKEISEFFSILNDKQANDLVEKIYPNNLKNLEVSDSSGYLDIDPAKESKNPIMIQKSKLAHTMTDLANKMNKIHEDINTITDEIELQNVTTNSNRGYKLNKKKDKLIKEKKELDIEFTKTVEKFMNLNFPSKLDMNNESELKTLYKQIINAHNKPHKSY